MINRAKMPRQLRNKGGIMTIGGGGYTGMPMGSRTGFGFISKLKDRVRKLIPNELANVAVKAAPFVAPFQPGVAALMRGLGRFDQRGSLSDALKQGLGTYAFGRGTRFLAGAEGPAGGFDTFSMEGFREGPIGSLFKGSGADPATKLGADTTTKVGADTVKGLKSVRDATGLFKDVPILGELPSIVQQQILVGGASAAATYIYNKFLAEEPPQEEGETIDEYLARRKENVGKKMRTYFDNYFKFDKDYSSMTDEQKDAFVARYNIATGGRVGYQTGGLTMANTLQQNIQRNLANQQAVAQQFARARQQLARQMGTPAPTVAPTPTAAPAAPARTVTPTAAPAAPKITLPKKQPSTGITTVMPVAGGGNVTFGPNIPSTGATAVGTPGIPGGPGSMQATPIQVPGGGGPMMASPGGGLGSMVRSMIPAMTQQVSMPAPMPPGIRGAGPGAMMLDPLQLFSGLNAQQLSQLPEKDFLALEKRFQALPQAEKDKLDKRINTMLDQQFKQLEADEKKFGSFADGRTLDVEAGRFAYNDLLAVLKNDYPNEFAKLTGNETLAELDQKLLDLTPETSFAAPRTRSGGINQIDTGTRSRIEDRVMAFRPDVRRRARMQNIGMAKGGMPTGIMRTNEAGVIERDYRDKGGFVPVGIKEKADDVPAMLSKNEFVFTADAVRGAGNGSIEKGAQRMYDTMKRLEKRMA